MSNVFNSIDNWVLRNSKIVQNGFLLTLAINSIMYLTFKSGTIIQRVEDLLSSLVASVVTVLGTYVILKVPRSVKGAKLLCNFAFYIFSFGYVANLITLSSDLRKSVLLAFPLASLILTCLFYKPKINNLEVE